MYLIHKELDKSDKKPRLFRFVYEQQSLFVCLICLNVVFPAQHIDGNKTILSINDMGFLYYSLHLSFEGEENCPIIEKYIFKNL